MQKMVALSAIAGEDIFGRGNGHMSVCLLDKRASILFMLNCGYTLQMLHNMQRSTVKFKMTNRFLHLAITKLVQLGSKLSVHDSYNRTLK